MFKVIEDKNQYVELFEQIIQEYGGFKRDKKRYVMRKNVGNALDDGGAYFGCVGEGKTTTGPYDDLSIVVFPSNEVDDSHDKWLVAFAVGSEGYENDYDIISLPGTRRMFVRNLRKGDYIKHDFIDITSKEGFSSFRKDKAFPETLSNAVGRYESCILACSLIDPNNREESETIMKTYLAIYAMLRDWPTNKTEKKKINAILLSQKVILDEEEEVKRLLKTRRYIVLQGAPGTGKTRMAKRIVGEKKHVYFTQFHAETTYNDFIYGIIPDMESDTLRYRSKEGVFAEALKKAIELENSGSEEAVYLIIDEINRANLSNVLGPVFYLFEPTMSDSNVSIEVHNGLSLKRLPRNFFVIATMNTADRSLAVVDFALRRRFAWFPMIPHSVDPDEGKRFNEEEFEGIAEIFELYANDEELNLQPGQAYFITSASDNGEEMRNRLKYEVMPLIKEYLAEGMLIKAKDAFVTFFRDSIGEEMFN